MKVIRTIVSIVLVAAVLGGCAKSKNICGIEYQPYGLLNSDDKKNPAIEYEVVLGNVVWGTVLFESVIAPIYFAGFSLFQPIGPKSDIKGSSVVSTKCP